MNLRFTKRSLGVVLLLIFCATVAGAVVHDAVHYNETHLCDFAKLITTPTLKGEVVPVVLTWICSGTVALQIPEFVPSVPRVATLARGPPSRLSFSA